MYRTFLALENTATPIDQIMMEIGAVLAGVQAKLQSALSKKLSECEVLRRCEQEYGNTSKDVQLAGGMICSGIEDAGGIIIPCIFIDRTGELIFIEGNRYLSDIKTRIYQVILIERILKVHLEGSQNPEIYMKDVLTPTHIQLLEKQGISISLGINEDQEKIIKLSLKN